MESFTPAFTDFWPKMMMMMMMMIPIGFCGISSCEAVGQTLGRVPPVPAGDAELQRGGRLIAGFAGCNFGWMLDMMVDRMF